MGVVGDFSTSATSRFPGPHLMRASDGHYYGTTTAQHGTIYRMTAAGVITTLHVFHGTDGSNPHARLVEGSDGYLWGTTAVGGAGGYGTIFRMSKAGELTVRKTIAAVSQAPPCIPEPGLLYAPLVEGPGGWA